MSRPQFPRSGSALPCIGASLIEEIEDEIDYYKSAQHQQQSHSQHVTDAHAGNGLTGASLLDLDRSLFHRALFNRATFGSSASSRPGSRISFSPFSLRPPAPIPWFWPPPRARTAG